MDMHEPVFELIKELETIEPSTLFGCSNLQKVLEVGGTLILIMKCSVIRNNIHILPSRVHDLWF